MRAKGIAIGNLFAQLFANFLLNAVDWLFEDLGIKYHGRYVDDMYGVHNNKKKLLKAVPVIRMRLANLGLQLNERKFYIQHYKKGIEFTGKIIKPGRAYVCNRVLTNFIIAVKRLNAAKNLRQIRYAVCSINSYLGILRQCDEYANRRRILNMIEPDKFKYVYIKGHYEILALKKKYQIRTQTLKRIRDGDY